jgi:hypothetical protein
MSDRKAAVPNVFLKSRGELEQAQGIGDHDAAFAHFGRDLVLFELKLFDELRIALGFLDRIQVLALQVFYQSQFQDGAIVGLAHNDRHLAQTQELGCAPSAFTRNQFKIAVALTDDEGLDDALFADGISELAQRFGRKILARLQRAGAYAAQGNPLDTFHGIVGRRGAPRRKQPAEAAPLFPAAI